MGVLLEKSVAGLLYQLPAQFRYFSLHALVTNENKCINIEKIT